MVLTIRVVEIHNFAHDFNNVTSDSFSFRLKNVFCIQWSMILLGVLQIDITGGQDPIDVDPPAPPAPSEYCFTLRSIVKSNLCTEQCFQDFKSYFVIFHQKRKRWYIHGILMLLAWVVLIPAGVITAKIRFNNPSDSMWFKVHIALNSLGLMAQLAGVIVILVYKADLSNSFQGTTIQKVHYFGGLTIVALGLLQPLNAVFRPDKAEPKTKRRQFWEYLHKGTGWLLVLAGIINCALPFDWISGSFLTLMVVLYIVGLVFVIIFGILQLFCCTSKEEDAAEKSKEEVYEEGSNKDPARRSIRLSES
jgi:hypothetical protein